jgi:hypothetical protein
VDVTRQALLEAATRLPGFHYDPAKSFRAWPRTLTHVADQGRPGQGSGDARVWGVLTTVEVREDLFQRLDDQFDLELLERAMTRVRVSDLSPQSTDNTALGPRV